MPLPLDDLGLGPLLVGSEPRVGVERSFGTLGDRDRLRPDDAEDRLVVVGMEPVLVAQEDHHVGGRLDDLLRQLTEGNVGRGVLLTLPLDLNLRLHVRRGVLAGLFEIEPRVARVRLGQPHPPLGRLLDRRAMRGSDTQD